MVSEDLRCARPGQHAKDNQAPGKITRPQVLDVNTAHLGAKRKTGTRRS